MQGARGCCFRWLNNNIHSIRMCMFHTLCWGIAFICAMAIDVDTDEESSLSNWCWFSETNDDGSNESDDTSIGSHSQSTQFALFFIPVGFTLLYNFKTLFWAKFRKIFVNNCTEHGRETVRLEQAGLTTDTNENQLQSSIDEIVMNYRYYILLSLIVCTWLLIAELITVFDRSRQNIIWSYCVLLVVFRLHGLGNLCIYMFRADVRHAWWKALYESFGWEYTLSISSLHKSQSSLEEFEQERAADTIDRHSNLSVHSQRMSSFSGVSPIGQCYSSENGNGTIMGTRLGTETNRNSGSDIYISQSSSSNINNNINNNININNRDVADDNNISYTYEEICENSDAHYARYVDVYDANDNNIKSGIDDHSVSSQGADDSNIHNRSHNHNHSQKSVSSSSDGLYSLLDEQFLNLDRSIEDDES